MPIGSIPSTRRIGIANATVKNASSFASTVLHLPAGSPIYQQQLVHSTSNASGPAKAAAELCGTADNDISRTATIREISAADTRFARRNLEDSTNYTFLSHLSSYTNQIYYVNNEPEAGSLISLGDSCSGDCRNPRDRGIDPLVSSCFIPNTTFWEDVYIAPDPDPPDLDKPPNPARGNCDDDEDTAGKYILPNAMAYVYLRMKSEAEWAGRGHTVLPPSSIDAPLGATSAYWQTFYDAVHINGASSSCGEQDPITPSSLKALHIHHYSNDPNLPKFAEMDPLESVAMSATWIRKGAKWYRDHYANPIPADILLSEMGHDWRMPTDWYWAGGWHNFRDGLSWWNTYLCWLTRLAAMDCYLQGWDTGAHTFYSCIHAPAKQPYITKNAANTPNRNQWYFNSDAWATYVYYNIPAYTPPNISDKQTTYTLYKNSFPVNNPISWGGNSWHTTPFGACSAVWAQVGADPTGQDLNTGWVLSTQQGIAGSASVSLPQGFSTVYFPVIKTMGTFDSATQFSMQWVRDGQVCPRGFMAMSDFQDSAVYDYNGFTQSTYSAMVYPVVCYAGTARTVTVRLSRNISGVGAWLGRPIVLSGACSWFVTQ